MAIDVRMPKLSDNMEEGVIIRWMKAPGDTVAKGEPLAEVETDKADVELEAADAGVLQSITVPEGQSAVVGAVIAVLAAPGEGTRERRSGDDGGTPRRSDATPAAETPASGRSGAKAVVSASPARAPSEPGVATARATPPAAPAERRSGRPRTETIVSERGPEPPAPAQASERAVRASPLAWRLAEDAGINLAAVPGSGPGGRILQRDVEAAVRQPADAVPRAARDGADAPVPAAAKDTAAGGRTIETSRMRLAIAKRMAESKREIPHFYVRAEIDMSEAVKLRESIKRTEMMPGVTMTHLILRALAIALPQHPRVNGSWGDGAIDLHDDVNLGIAVAVEDGLVVPVLHRAQRLTLAEIVSGARALTEKARSGKFSGPELTGGTFSLSNIGMLDIDELVAVINPPQAAILAVGAVKERPVVRDGRLAIAKTMRATLSCDHRVLNGVEGGWFLEALKGILENPVVLLLE